ncbi:hypothetical protein Y032_0089g2258 [Ancylostoma ceylanicum]|uniref:Uncharacterized protein n=1 Tax=Ancylostoma ceylanicum TaxID=53326 RepID=A0A016TMG6_9BILA|nr:hypothetical protein Y032_0089g2258 [Ancylostoma ceylanicum]
MVLTCRQIHAPTIYLLLGWAMSSCGFSVALELLLFTNNINHNKCFMQPLSSAIDVIRGGAPSLFPFPGKPHCLGRPNL